MEIFPEIAGYDIIDLLGQGGNSRVFRGKKHRTGQTVALKVLSVVHGNQEQYRRTVERFKREAQICAHLQHPHIVKLTDSGQTTNGEYFAEYEYVPGPTLKQTILERGALSAEETGHLMAQVLDALSCAHANGIVHRDLKPQNIIVTRTGSASHIKVLDFGIGAFSPEVRLNDYQNLTLTQEVVCTPTYAAPEQLRGEPPTIKSDIYAWGLIVLECLLGSPVIKGYTIAEIYQQQLSGEDVPIPPAIARHPLGNLLRLSLHKRSSERIGQAERLYADFKALNFATLVGALATPPLTNGAPLAGQEQTITLSGLREDRRQISVLACRLVLSHASGEQGHELIDTLLADLLHQCESIGQMHGAQRANQFCDHIVFYFGYPFVSDDDCRRAARVALDIAGKMQHAASHVARQHGMTLSFHLGLHTGMVTVRKNTTPYGLTPAIAMHLANHEQNDKVLVSDSSAQLLQQYWLLDPCAAPLVLHQHIVPALRLKGERDVEAMSIFNDIRRKQHAIIGRQSELSCLLKHWQQVVEGSTEVTLVRGDAGIGKSRLVFELRQQLAGQHVKIVEGRCAPEHKNNALYPIFNILRQMLRLDTERDVPNALQRLQVALQHIGADLALTMPIFCSWLWLPLPQQFEPILHSPQKQKSILLDTLEQLLLHSDAANPKLIIIEDLHWADPTTLEWLDKLCQSGGTTPTWLLFTARPHFVPPWPAECGHILEIAHLTQDESASLIKDIIGNKNIAPNALAFLAQRIDGVPLFAEELLAMLLEKQILVERADSLHLSDDPNSARIPLTLKDSLNYRLQNAGAAREVAQFAAVLGREFSADLLAQVLIRDQQSLTLDLEQLTALDLVYRKRNIEGDSYIFRHALIRDAAYDSLKSDDRKSIHLRVANLLEAAAAQTSGQQLAETRANYQQIAQHYAESDQYDKAIAFGAQSSDICLQQFLIEETLEQGKKVERWIAKSERVQPSMELSINRIMMQALMAKHGWADQSVSQYASRSQALAAKLQDFTESDPAIWTMAATFIFHFVKCNPADMNSVHAQMLKFAQTLQSQGLMAAATLMKGFDEYNNGNYPAAEKSFATTIELYVPEQHQHFDSLFGFDILAWAKGIRAIVLWQLGQWAESDQMLDEAIAWARKRAHIPSICINLLYQGILSQYRGNKVATLQASEELLQLSNQYGLPAFSGYATPLHLWANSHPDLAAADQVIAILLGMGCNISLSFYASLAADTAFEQGNAAEAIRRIDTCLELAHKNQELGYEVNLYWRKGLYLLRTNSPDYENAKACLTQGLLRAKARSMSQVAASIEALLQEATEK